MSKKPKLKIPSLVKQSKEMNAMLEEASSVGDPYIKELEDEVERLRALVLAIADDSFYLSVCDYGPDVEDDGTQGWACGKANWDCWEEAKRIKHD